MESDGCYFRRRADEEFAAAKTAACELSQAAHFELGERYSQFAAAIDAVNEQIGPLPGAMAPRRCQSTIAPPAFQPRNGKRGPAGTE